MKNIIRELEIFYKRSRGEIFFMEENINIFKGREPGWGPASRPCPLQSRCPRSRSCAPGCRWCRGRASHSAGAWTRGGCCSLSAGGCWCGTRTTRRWKGVIMRFRVYNQDQEDIMIAMSISAAYLNESLNGYSEILWFWKGAMLLKELMMLFPGRWLRAMDSFGFFTSPGGQ